MKLTPFLVSGVIFLGLLVSGAYAWEYTNSPEFCGMQCHSMPPEYTAYQLSPHAQVKCVECHIGREFVGNQFTRKAGDFRHVVSSLTKNYEYPITAHTMRPATETCERCHTAEKFSDSSLKTIPSFAPDAENTLSETHILLHTGGGLAAEGLGEGIHWHIENQVLFYATDERQQEIPYVKMIDREAGIITEFVDVTSDFDPYSISEEDLEEMDCITCHNRISHAIPDPETAVDQAMFKELIPPEIPGIRARAVELLRAPYDSNEQAMNAISGLTRYYQENYPDFYETRAEMVFRASDVLKDIYAQSVFPDQKVDWDTHPNNLGHTYDPGCFRCHDGKHMSSGTSAIRVECNLCHTTPVVAGPGTELVQVNVSNETAPDTHKITNWIVLHTILYDEDAEDEPCSGCHDTSSIASDNTTFCSNSACHGGAQDIVDFQVLEEAGRHQAIIAKLPHFPDNLEPITAWEETPSLDTIHVEHEDGPQECEDCHDVWPPVGPPSNSMCIACHGETEEGVFQLTANLEPNPHDGHEGEASCAFCHKNFGPPIEPCALCHEDVAMVPVEASGQ